MRIGIDFHLAERPGTGNCTYMRNLVEALVTLDGEDEFLLYVGNSRYPYYETFWRFPHIRLRPLHSSNPVARILLLGAASLVDRLDLLHVNYYGPPAFGGKLVVTIHDLSFLSIPECFSTFERVKNKILIPVNVRRASGILTVSEYSRQDLIRQYRVPPERVAVTYNGVRSMFSADIDRAAATRTVSAYGVAGRYFLFVGRLNKRKNLKGLIQAFFRLKAASSIPHQLVIAGIRDFLPLEELDLLRSSIYEPDVVFTGFLPEADLPSFLALAEAFVFPTFYEGFGLPCLEAMACGCPVISSRVTSIPEVVGDAGLLVDPSSVEDLAAAMDRVISDETRRQAMITRGIEQARQFRWERTARETLDAFRRFSAS